MKIAVVVAGTLVLGLALGLAACSSSSSQDPGLQGDGVGGAAAAPDVNPSGVQYPTDNIGRIARQGAIPGKRIENFKFLGYPDANVSGGLQAISLAQFYDPTGANYKIIHLQAAGVWCSACRAETEVLVPLKEQLVAKKAIWIVSLAEGPTPGDPSKPRDLDGWINEFKSPFTHVLDPGNKNLGPFYDRTALPWNANIDATTMEILTSGTGAIVDPSGILKEIDDALAAAADSKLKQKPSETTTP